MKALIWKEFRLNWPILAVGVALMISPYVFPLLIDMLDGSGWNPHRTFRDVWELVAASLMASVLTIALLGGHVIACEKADRSAEFLAYQPISKGKILLSKLVIPIAAVSTIWIGNISLGVALEEVYSSATPTDIVLMLWCAASTGLLAFGVAWLVSTVQSSPTYAVFAGIVAPIAIGLSFVAIEAATRIRIDAGTFAGIYLAISLLCGALSFTGGTWYYLHRVEP